jgi:hypothetical protein
VLQRLVEVAPPPVAPTPPTPHDDPAFQQVKGRITSHGRKAKSHPPASTEVKKAHEAAQPPANDKEAQAKTEQAAKMNAAKPGEFDRAGFIAAVKKAIDAASPKTLEDADKFSSSGKAGEIKGQVLGKVDAGKTAATGEIKEATAQAPDPSHAKEKPVTPLAPDAAPPAAGDPGAANAMPGPAPAEQTNLGAGAAETSNAMESAGVTEQQLAESNEPQFQTALESKKKLEEQSAKAPVEYREGEKATVGGAKAQAAGSAQAGVVAMSHAKAGSTTKAAAQKQASKAQDEAAQQAFTTKVDAIFNTTKQETQDILKGIDEKVSTTFTSGEAEAHAAFDAKHKADMEAYKDKRYSGWDGAARWLKDKIFSPPPEVNQIYEQAKALYLTKMDDVIGKIADLVGAELTRARERIARGRKEIDAEVAAAPKNIKKFALEKQQTLSGQFDDLEKDVDAKQDAVVEDLAQKYVEARNVVDQQIKAMQDANKGLWDQAKDAVGGVIETIKKLKDMLLGVLAKAAGAIDKIISKPIEFLGNLVNAIKTGLSNFVGNIAEHLKGALQQWLFGALADAGIELPKSFDLKGILHLIFQILGLTWANIRGRIVKGLGAAGEAIMTKIEQGVEVIKIIVNEGLPGLWKLIVEKISDLKDQVIGKIKDFVITKIVIAGVTWLVSMLNPASAFVKACKMIYDVVMFFVEKGEAIMEFVNTVLDSIGAIASGAIGGAASAIEGVLKKILPIALGFLASLLGLGGISDKIKSILEAVQKPVTKVLDSIIGTAIKYGKKLFGKGIAWVKGKAKQVKDWGKKKLEQGKAWLKGRVQDVKAKATGKDTEESRKVKEAALNEAAGSLHGKSSLAEFNSALRAIEQKHASAGLKSLRAKVDPASLEITIEAKASEPVGRVITWETAFDPSLHPASMTALLDELRQRLQKKGPESDKAFSTDTPVWAALSLNGVFAGQERNIPGGTHAEVRLLESRWPSVLGQAIETARANPEGKTRLVFAIDRTPCPECSTRLKSAIANAKDQANNAGVLHQLTFTLAITSNYEGGTLSGKKVAEQTAAGAPPGKTTMISATRAVEDIGGLVHAGWDVRQLLARDVQNKTWDAPLAQWLEHLATPEMKARMAKRFSAKT